jgi:MFS family permease
LENRDIKRNTHFKTIDSAFIAIFSALYIVMNLFLGPLSFQLLGLPILHDFGIFFTLLLVVWITGRFGTSIAVAFIGSAIAILLGAPPLIVGFAVSSIIFDFILIANHHKIRNSFKGLVIPALATVFAPYVAGVIIGVLFMSNGVQWALTVWGGWHVVGGILTIAITLPIIAGLEKANVRRLVNK